MKHVIGRRWAWGGATVLAMTFAAVVVPAAEEVFSKSVPPAEFSAAGLGKLSAAELARLDALVRDFGSGALAEARWEAAVAAEARARAEASAARAVTEMRAAKAAAATSARATEDAANKKVQAGRPAKARVTLAPGTEVDYSNVESRIVGEFHGWSGRTVFVLENGQRWQSAGESTYVSPLIASPAVQIKPGMFGVFWLTVEGVNSRVKVTLIGAK